MTTPKVTILILAVVFYSCNNVRTEKVEVKADTLVSLEEVQIPGTLIKTPTYFDSIKRFVVDDYPVPDELLNCTDSSSVCEIKYKELVSVDKIWFTNDSLKQTLVFETYTDHHRLAIFHFYNSNVPAELIKKMELHTPDRETASESQKLEHFKGFVSSGRKIISSYFHN